MDKTNSDKLVNFLEQRLSVDQKVKRVQRKVEEYMKHYNYEEYVDNPTKRVEEKIKDIEGILDRMDETKQRSDVVMKFAQDAINDMVHWIDDISAVIESITTSTSKVATRNNELVLKLSGIERQLFEEKTRETQTDKEKEEIRRRYNKRVNGLNEMIIENKDNTPIITSQNEIIELKTNNIELRRKNQELKEQIIRLKQENMVLKEEINTISNNFQ
ncbi:hypothetical protein EDI_016300 [Entamoeba dispar SAW760]|uniref:Uncharacterized protein n=1 Tax=Entamoeba dispar (strain ATCC PRA-260 / SAW760) TaxID=370354 RepID=B0ENM1_ENTDS|nr:uncharacterized protein EDI_016300 [Entamoeba dispar SAW760]EDR23848.1 hypothetical protein EDI_016300 [Entamoeba dispar SAW760]|eukprot:EDR23848.1 hypothetical protein EDI_016300 [Entamoeba dispar SAW760]